MDDLEVNPLYKALVTKYRRHFELACKHCYLVAVPRSDSLEDCVIDQSFAAAHILKPSRLLKWHFEQLQPTHFDDIELDNGRLVCHWARKQTDAASGPLVVRVLAEEIGYNALSKEFRTLLIERPLVGLLSRSVDEAAASSLRRSLWAPLSTRLTPVGPLARRQRAQLARWRALVHHDDCAKYLDSISAPLTAGLQAETRRMHANYIVLAHYLDDAARRARSIVDLYLRGYERCLVEASLAPDWLWDTCQRSVRLAVENFVVHLLHAKLMDAVQQLHERDERKFQRSLEALGGAELSICQLGARPEFAHFALNDELARRLKRLPGLQSPISMVTCLVQLIDLITGQLAHSAHLERLLAQPDTPSPKAHSPATPICSDDLIAALVYSIPRAKPAHLFSAVKYLELFGWTAVEREHSSYYLATLSSAVEYIRSFGDGAQPEVAREHTEARTRDTSAPAKDRVSRIAVPKRLSAHELH